MVSCKIFDFKHNLWVKFHSNIPQLTKKDIEMYGLETYADSKVIILNPNKPVENILKNA